MPIPGWKKTLTAAFLTVAAGLSGISPALAKKTAHADGAVSRSRPGVSETTAVQTGRSENLESRAPTDEAVSQTRPDGNATATVQAGGLENRGNRTRADQSARDPFSASDKLTARTDKPRPRPAGPQFTPREQAVKIPKMHLRGHLQGKNGQVIALLEIEGGGVYLVRENDTVGLHEFGYDSVIRIKQINRLYLVIESGSLGKAIIVR